VIAALAVLVTIAQAGSPSPQPSPEGRGGILPFDEAMRQAEERNLDLKAAQARLSQAQLISRKAWAGYLPQVSVGGSYTRNNAEAVIRLPTGYWVRDVGQQVGPDFDPAQPQLGRPTSYAMVPSGVATATIQPYDQLGAQAQLTQALLVPALWPAIRNAYLAEDVAALSVENVRREILFAVAQLYYGAAALRQAIGVNERLLEVARAHEKDARVRVDVGAMPKMALLRAEIDRLKAEEDLKRAQNAYANARLALGTLLDREGEFEVDVPPEVVLPVNTGELSANALEARPDVQAAAKSLELAESARSGTFFKYLPNVVATGTYRLSNAGGFTGKNDSWAVGVGLSWLIWDGGLREVELRENGYKVVEAEAMRRSAEIKARDEVKRALLDVESARANRTKAAEQLSLARENISLVQKTFEAGTATYLEVTDAQAALAGAETGLVAETLNTSLAGLKLLKAAGLFAKP
jgi:outer membrane protein TolC